MKLNLFRSGSQFFFFSVSFSFRFCNQLSELIDIFKTPRVITGIKEPALVSAQDGAGFVSLMRLCEIPKLLSNLEEALSTSSSSLCLILRLAPLMKLFAHAAAA